MGRRKAASFVDSATLARAEADLNGLPQGRVTLRLLAVIAAGQDRRLDDVASFFRTTRQTVATWISRYRSKGLAGLTDLPKGHRRASLSRIQVKTIQHWVERGEAPSGEPVHWTIALLREAILKAFGVTLGKTRVWLLLREWGFGSRCLVPATPKPHRRPRRPLKKTSSRLSR